MIMEDVEPDSVLIEREVGMKCGTDRQVFCNKIRAVRLSFLKSGTGRNSVGKSFSKGLGFHRPAPRQVV